MAFSMTPVFIKSDSVLGAALMDENGSAISFHQESSVYDRVMSRIQNVLTVQSVEENSLLGVEFWECLKKGTLQWITVSDGVYVYDYGQGLDFGSVEEHGNLILQNEHYRQCMAENYTLITTIEESDPSQDWIGQEMIQPQVRMIKEMLKFTDVEIRNALQILHDRGEAITFPSLVHILVMRGDAIVNVFAGIGRYGFSADIQLVLHKCYDIYGREPTHAEFDDQYNRIKEHLINQLAVKDEEMTNINRDKERLQERARLLDNQVTMEQQRALQERNRVDHRHMEKLVKLEQEKEAERVKAVKLEQEKEAERVKAVKLEQEKEAERVKAVKLEQEKEAERVKAEAEREQLKQFFEEEKRKMMAQFEAEKRQLLLKMQQPS